MYIHHLKQASNRLTFSELYTSAILGFVPTLTPVWGIEKGRELATVLGYGGINADMWSAAQLTGGRH
jgi:hypothetical protein